MESEIGNQYRIVENKQDCKYLEYLYKLYVCVAVLIFYLFEMPSDGKLFHSKIPFYRKRVRFSK